jgi:lysophospholipase L1-like esterase
MQSRVIVFGDSIAYGAWDSKGGWADRIKQDFHARTSASNFKHKFQLLNASVGGNMTSDIASRISVELPARYSSAWEHTVVLAVGINDTRRPDGIPPDEMIDHLDAALHEIRDRTDKVLIIGLTPLVQAKLPFKGYTYFQADVEERNDLIAGWAKRNNLPFVDLLDEARKSSVYNDSLEDGLHPTDAGHGVLYNIIKPRLQAVMGVPLGDPN